MQPFFKENTYSNDSPENKQCFQVNRKRNKNYATLYSNELLNAEKILKMLQNARYSNHHDEYVLKKIKKLEKILGRNIYLAKKNNGIMLYKDFYQITKYLQSKYNEKYPEVSILIDSKHLNATNPVNIIYRIILFFKNLFGKTYVGGRKIKFNRYNQGLQIVPLQASVGHASIAIIDNFNKSVVIFEPNGRATKNIDVFKNVNSKYDALRKIFHKEDVDFLLKNDYKLCDANNCESFCCLDCADIKVKTNEEKNTISSRLPLSVGACGYISMKFCTDFIKQLMFYKNNGYKINNYKNFLENVNKTSIPKVEAYMYSRLHKAINVVSHLYTQYDLNLSPEINGIFSKQ